jgi:hypothetical protein
MVGQEKKERRGNSQIGVVLLAAVFGRLRKGKAAQEEVWRPTGSMGRARKGATIRTLAKTGQDKPRPANGAYVMSVFGGSIAPYPDVPDHSFMRAPGDHQPSISKDALPVGSLEYVTFAATPDGAVNDVSSFLCVSGIIFSSISCVSRRDELP